MSSDFLADRRRGLEESFFDKKNRELLEQMKSRLAQQSAKSALSSVLGITDDVALDALVKANVAPEMAAALSLVPLVQVAWADGQLDAQEAAAIQKAARENGITEESPSYHLLLSHLNTKPSPELYAAWKEYTRVLASTLDAGSKAALKTTLLARAKAVANAAGGFLGVGKISKVEADVLAEIEKAL